MKLLGEELGVFTNIQTQLFIICLEAREIPPQCNARPVLEKPTHHLFPRDQKYALSIKML